MAPRRALAAIAALIGTQAIAFPSMEILARDLDTFNEGALLARDFDLEDLIDRRDLDIESILQERGAEEDYLVERRDAEEDNLYYRDFDFGQFLDERDLEAEELYHIVQRSLQELEARATPANKGKAAAKAPLSDKDKAAKKAAGANIRKEREARRE